MTDVALLGGSFNPIGLHHKEIARRVWEFTGMPVWMMPCYGHQFSKNSDLIEPHHRWNMLTAACENYEFMIPCDWEIQNQHNGSMFSTIEKFSELHLDTTFSIVIGVDNANVVESKWDRGSHLIQKSPFVVCKREGCLEISDWFKQDPHRIIEFSTSGSSTDIRNAIRLGNNDVASQLLEQSVWNYIQTNKLYGYKGD